MRGASSIVPAYGDTGAACGCCAALCASSWIVPKDLAMASSAPSTSTCGRLNDWSSPSAWRVIASACGAVSENAPPRVASIRCKRLMA